MTYLDTNVLLYAIFKDEKYGRVCARILEAIESKRLKVGSSSLVLVEVMGALRKWNGTQRRGRKPTIDVTKNIEAILSLPIVWFDLTVYVVERANGYDYPIQTADCIHLATADLQGMSGILTADQGFDSAAAVAKRIDPLDWSGS